MQLDLILYTDKELKIPYQSDKRTVVFEGERAYVRASKIDCSHSRLNKLKLIRKKWDFFIYSLTFFEEKIYIITKYDVGLNKTI